MRRLLSVFLLGAGLMFGPVLAEEGERMHVDINAVEDVAELRPVDGITAAGQPDLEHFKLIAAAGYEAVVDLRGLGEDRGLDQAAVLEELGLEYVVLPLSSPDAISFDNASKLDKILSRFDGPVLVHCGSGNRVGALLALRHRQTGASVEEALDYGRQAGMTGLEPVVRARLAEQE